MENINLRIKKLRKENNLTQKELGNALNFSRTTIANYEQELRTPSSQTIIKIADFFKVSVDYLLGITQNKYITSQRFHHSNQILLIINIKTGQILDSSFKALSLYKYPESLLNKSFFEISSHSKAELYDLIKSKSIFYFKDRHLLGTEYTIPVKIFFDYIDKDIYWFLIIPEG